MNAPPARLPPVKPTTACTALSFLMMPTTCFSFSCIDWNDTLSSARTPAKTMGDSWVGKNPLGTTTYR